MAHTGPQKPQGRALRNPPPRRNVGAATAATSIAQSTLVVDQTNQPIATPTISFTVNDHENSVPGVVVHDHDTNTCDSDTSASQNDSCSTKPLVTTPDNLNNHTLDVVSGLQPHQSQQLTQSTIPIPQQVTQQVTSLSTSKTEPSSSSSTSTTTAASTTKTSTTISSLPPSTSSTSTTTTTTTAPNVVRSARGKVPRSVGHSSIDWANLQQQKQQPQPQQQQQSQQQNGTRSKATSSTTTTTPSRTVTLEEVATHGKRSDAWIVLHGTVYDVTEYAAFHPGGVRQLMRGAGRDCTSLFMQTHPWVNAARLLRTHVVGQVAAQPTSRQFLAPGDRPRT